MQQDLLTLVTQCWYAWQMLPGYGNTPYFSPILVKRVVSRKTGGGLLALDFFNAFYASGVQDFSLAMRVLKRAADYLVAEIEHRTEELDRTAIISKINYDWIKSQCHQLLARHPMASIGDPKHTDVQSYLNGVSWTG
jgi:hypothetical protein